MARCHRWRTTVSLLRGQNGCSDSRLTRRGELVGEDTVTVATTTTDNSQRSFLRVTELMYHPGGPTAIELAAGFGDADDFEFIEMGNFGPSDVSLMVCVSPWESSFILPALL